MKHPTDKLTQGFYPADLINKDAALFQTTMGNVSPVVYAFKGNM
jgi:hypothetical protein